MSLRHALLGLLVDRPASGYDLLKEFESSLALAWPATQSQVYTELTRLDDSGLITVSAHGPRGRKEYALTAEGLAELQHWLTETTPTQHARSDLLLRVFFLGVLTPAQGRDYLRWLARISERHQERLQAAEEEIGRGDGDPAVHSRIALEYGLRFNAMRREWAEWAEGQIRDGH
ncbi:PadR family transcriptional regulator [Kitasatospora sp. NBC_00085]|uniref:PadR family transcriptional regulator n=1 Tax=unclassified Kitasatospora TaxID=2633591 RepID=UPI003254D679